jgi:hypothetical protein
MDDDRKIARLPLGPMILLACVYGGGAVVGTVAMVAKGVSLDWGFVFWAGFGLAVAAASLWEIREIKAARSRVRAPLGIPPKA